MLPDFLRRAEGVRGDVWVKIGAVLGAWSYVSVLWKLLPIFPNRPPLVPAYTFDWFELFGLHLVGVFCAIAYWNMKRWGVVGLALLGAMRFATIAQQNLGGALLFTAVFTALPLLPAAFRWRSMTWR